jgi:hypothetical protein
MLTKSSTYCPNFQDHHLSQGLSLRVKIIISSGLKVMGRSLRRDANSPIIIVLGSLNCIIVCKGCCKLGIFRTLRGIGVLEKSTSKVEGVKIFV